MKIREQFDCRRRGRASGLVCVLVLALGFVAPAAGQALGRFFSTPDERALLNELRANRDLVAPEPEPVAEVANPEPVVERLSIDGLVIRSGGANSAWVNGRPVFDGWTTREGVRVDTATMGRSGRVKITLPSGTDTIDLKPGQKIDVLSGVVVEGYQPQAPPGGASVFSSPNPDGSTSAAESGAADVPAGAPAVAPPATAGEVPPEDFLEQLRRALGGG